jgi:hypothetical protein
MKKYLFKRGRENKMKYRCHTCGGGVYFLGFIGAVVYYIQNAVGFWNGVLGVLKSIVWPAILIYKLLGFLG